MKIRKTLFWSVLLTLGVVVVSLVAAAVIAVLVVRSTVNPLPKPALFLAQVLEAVPPESRAKALESLDQQKIDFPVDFSIHDSTGRTLYPDRREWDLKAETSKPTEPLQSQTLSSEENAPFAPPPHENAIILLPGEPAQYLVTRGKSPLSRPFGIVLGILALLMMAIVVGVSSALSYIFGVIRHNLTLLDDVMVRLKNGDLKARLQNIKSNEVGAAMIRFNQMADEIERLVENLRLSERARGDLLQELAHDLRTPVASLKSLITTVSGPNQELATETKKEIFDLCIAEINYFQQLIEDLLFLSQMNEPQYRVNTDHVDVKEMVEDVIEEFSAVTKNVRIELISATSSKVTLGAGDRVLVKRLIKNSLSNALTFARSKVSVKISDLGSKVGLDIEDDGKGFSIDALNGFGERKVSRFVEHNGDGRVSIGLGSVIIKKIAVLHRGEVIPQNILGDNGPLGARLSITLTK